MTTTHDSVSQRLLRSFSDYKTVDEQYSCESSIHHETGATDATGVPQLTPTFGGMQEQVANAPAVIDHDI